MERYFARVPRIALRADLSGRAWRTFIAICRDVDDAGYSNISFGQIEELTGIPRAEYARLIRAIETAGLIRRESVPRQRSRYFVHGLSGSEIAASETAASDAAASGIAASKSAANLAVISPKSGSKITAILKTRGKKGADARELAGAAHASDAEAAAERRDRLHRDYALAAVRRNELDRAGRLRIPANLPHDQFNSANMSEQDRAAIRVIIAELQAAEAAE